jgi:serine/threonine protein kinase
MVQIEKELFRSQNGAVFKARRVQGHANALLGQVVCLKERRVAELGAHKDMMNEVKLLQSVQHPNVVKCFGSFRDPIRGSLFIVLECVQF